MSHLDRHLQGLPRLHRLLRAAGLAHGVDCWINAQDLLFRLHRQNRLPQQPEELRPLLGPLFCRSADDQDRFRALFQEWLRDPLKAEQSEDEEQAALEQAIEQIRPVAAPLPTKEPPTHSPRPRWWIIPLVLLVVLSLTWVAVDQYLGGQIVVDTTPTPPPPKPDEPTPPDQPKIEDDYLKLPLQPLPPRSPPEPVVLDPSYQRGIEILGWLLSLLPLLVVIGFLTWRWWRRWVALHRGAADSHDPFCTLRLRAPSDDVFDSPLIRTALRQLHNPIHRPTRRLDEPATVRSSLRKAGLFDPVYWDRPEVPEILVLVEFTHANDHLAGLGELVVERLRGAGLVVHRYDYRGDPRWVVSSGNRRRWNLLSLATHHENARLLLVGDPTAFVDLWRGRPKGWTGAFVAWPQRGLLTTRPGEGEWWQLVQSMGFRLLPLSGAGLVELGNSMSNGRHRSLPVQPLPSAVLTDDRWHRPLPPAQAQRDELLRLLCHNLQGDGLYLLGAMAAYPQLHWGLSRALDRSLFDQPGGAEQREQRLLRIAQLPWCRRGWLPDWLREDLLDSLTRYQRRRVYQVYLELFRRVTDAASGAIQLPITLPPPALGWWARVRRRFHRRERSWGAFLRDLLRFSSPGSLYRDRIFASLIMGKGEKLDLKLPSAFAGLMPGLSRLAAMTGMAGWLLLGIALSGLAYWGWGEQGPSTVREFALSRQMASHEDVAVRIHSADSTTPLADSLQQILQAQGFNRLSRVKETELPPLNRVRFGPGVDPEQAGFVAARLAYLLYRDLESNPLKVEIGDTDVERGVIRVDLAPAKADPQSILRDPLDQDLQETDKAKFSHPDNFAAEKPAPAPGSRFQDDLRDGGQGPEMVVIPAGSFTMGSPDSEAGRYEDEGPVHRVTIPRPFALGSTEVTFDDYDRFADATGRKRPGDQGWGRGSRPVIDVSWDDARAYAQWLSEQTGQEYRLPSEAEWEYAARAGTAAARYWGGDSENSEACGYANSYDLTTKEKYGVSGSFECNDGFVNTAFVASFKANDFGIYDMLGNVWEWTEDCWHGNYQGAPVDGAAWLDGQGGDCTRRVVRGGGWDDLPQILRSAVRNGDKTDGTYKFIGFRLARAL